MPVVVTYFDEPIPFDSSETMVFELTLTAPAGTAIAAGGTPVIWDEIAEGVHDWAVSTREMSVALRSGSTTEAVVHVNRTSGAAVYLKDAWISHWES